MFKIIFILLNAKVRQPRLLCEGFSRVSELDLYNPRTVSRLFDEMSGTYGFVNLVASFGFAALWRHVLISKISGRPQAVDVVDLMTGMGELFHGLRRRRLKIQRVHAIDFSAGMCERARREAGKNSFQTQIIQADVFDPLLPDASADVVLCSFGLKTLSSEQQKQLAREVYRLLRPGGQFSFIEISRPRGKMLCAAYEFYLSVVIPIIGKLCMGNPDSYRMLGIYTKRFGNSRSFMRDLEEAGVEAHYFEHFFGCASGVHGTKAT